MREKETRINQIDHPPIDEELDMSFEDMSNFPNIVMQHDDVEYPESIPDFNGSLNENQIPESMNSESLQTEEEKEKETNESFEKSQKSRNLEEIKDGTMEV